LLTNIKGKNVANEYTYTEAELDKLHDDLKAYEIKLATYLSTDAGKQDNNYSSLQELDIQLNLQIYNLSNMQLQLAGDNAGSAVSAINSAVSNLNAVIAKKEAVARDIAIAQAAVSLVVAITARNPSAIIAAGGALVTKLRAA
jgi:hypothetical protein